jgi:hypothetical protein
MNKQIIIVITMVVAMMFFMVSIVRHFMEGAEYVKEQEAARRDSLIDAQIKHLTNNQSVLKEAIRSQEFRIDGMKVTIDNVNYKVNVMTKMVHQ